MGRPSLYTPELAEIICEKLVSGQSLRKICRSRGMPAISAVMRWLIRHPEFEEQYARAREAQADTLADEILHIADTPKVGIKTKTVAGVVETTKGDMLEHRRLQVEARKWIAAKLKPKKYGDRLSLDSTVRHTADAYSDDELARIAGAGRGGAPEAPSREKEPGELH